MRWSWCVMLAMAGCLQSAPAVEPDIEPVVEGSIEFSGHSVSPTACRDHDDELECRVYSVWFTNTGNTPISTQYIGWFVNKTTTDPLGRPTGWTASNCPYAQGFGPFEVVPDRRVHMPVACLYPQGTVHDTIEAYHKTTPRVSFGVVDVT